MSVGIESATKICSSLSGEACPGTVATCTDAGEGTDNGAGVATTTPSETGFVVGDAAAGIEVGRWEIGMVVIVGLITGWGI